MTIIGSKIWANNCSAENAEGIPPRMVSRFHIPWRGIVGGLTALGTCASILGVFSVKSFKSSIEPNCLFRCPRCLTHPWDFRFVEVDEDEERERESNDVTTTWSCEAHIDDIIIMDHLWRYWWLAIAKTSEVCKNGFRRRPSHSRLCPICSQQLPDSYWRFDSVSAELLIRNRYTLSDYIFLSSGK